MSLHAAASVLRIGGTILVYGANDEGIRPAAGLMGEILTGTDTVAVGGRCRVLRGIRGEEVRGLRSDLESWKETTALDYPGLRTPWVSYPGVFSHGELDPGTRLLLDGLPSLPPGARVLDYGCGSGMVGAAAGSRGDGVSVESLDVDAIALEAARENVPGARLVLGDGLGRAGPGPFDAVLSNPPLHRGKSEDPAMVTSLIEEAPPLLGPSGVLTFVVQRRLPVEEPLRRSFRTVSVPGEDPTFRVWEGRGPISPGSRPGRRRAPERRRCGGRGPSAPSRSSPSE
jgi:16S rRNA (guanine1207-N2)-methyltransferase